jgi:hypothetical protein
MKRVLLLSLLCCLVSCAKKSVQDNNKSVAKPSVSANEKKEAAKEAAVSPSSDVPFSREDDYDPSDSTGSKDTRQEARQKAIEYAQVTFPGWHVKGIISRPTFDGHFQITLDLEKGNQTNTVQLLLRRFFPAKGEPYWKVDPFIAQSLSRQYQELAYLRFVDGQEYNYDDCRYLVLENLEEDDVPDSLRESIIETYREEADDSQDYEPYDPRN